MHAAVKFLHTEELGHKPTIGFRGNKHVHCVINDGAAVRVVRIPPRDFDLSPPLLLNDKPYPLERIIGQLRTFGQRKGITQQAADLLNVASAEQDLDENILDALPEDTPEGRAAADRDYNEKYGPVAQSEPELHGNKSVSPKSDKRGSQASPKPDPLPRPPKGAKTAAKAPKAAGSGLIGELATAAGIAPPKLRALLREAGFSAPYTDRPKLEAAIRKFGGK